MKDDDPEGLNRIIFFWQCFAWCGLMTCVALMVRLVLFAFGWR